MFGKFAWTRTIFDGCSTTMQMTTRSRTPRSAFRSRFERPSSTARKQKSICQTGMAFPGFVSYSYTVGNAWFPVTGGFFSATTRCYRRTGHFPDSQDQRNTVRGRVRYQVARRVWIAGGVQYDSGSALRLRGHLRRGARRIWAAGCGANQFSTRPNLSFLSGQRLGGRGHLQIRAHEHAPSNRRRKPKQYPQRDRFWRTLLRQRHRPITQRSCAPVGHLLSANPPASLFFSNMRVSALATLRSERRSCYFSTPLYKNQPRLIVQVENLNSLIVFDH